jgi:hypothetical protein
MKLETETLDILKNFASINPSLMVKAGNVIKTISLSSSVIAKAKLNQTFANNFGIYDLSNFIAAMSMFDKPDLNFDDERFVTITDEEKSALVTYFFADPELMILPPEKEFEKPKTNIKFRITKENLADVLKAVSVLQLPEIVFVGDGTNVSVQTLNSKSTTSNLYKKVVSNSNADFQVYFKVENLKLLPYDYDVSIAPAKAKGMSGVAHFDGPGVEYWIAAEQHSKY